MRALNKAIAYWVGFPADDMAGVDTCGFLTHPDTGDAIHRSSGATRDMGHTISDLERRYGSFVEMLTSLDHGMDDVVGFITDQGYRVAFIEQHHMDKRTVQETIGEWVEGVW